MTRAFLAMLLVAMVMAVALAGGRVVRSDHHNALAIDALPRVQHQQVCEEAAIAGKELHHAGVVIVFPDGVDMFCVSFEGEDISGAELLQRTGLPLVLSGFGGLGSGVCRIDDVGCSDPSDCFCQCRGADCHYWTYFELDGSLWDFLNVGASQRRVHDGDVDGWVWGNGHTPPGTSSIGAICPVVEATPQPTATLVPRNDSSGKLATATPLPASGVAPSNGSSGGGRPAAIMPGVAAAHPSVTASAKEPATPAPRVVRQSSRPTKEKRDADGGAASDGGDGLPVGILAFGAVAAGLLVVGSGLLLKRRLDG